MPSYRFNTIQQLATGGAGPAGPPGNDGLAAPTSAYTLFVQFAATTFAATTTYFGQEPINTSSTASLRKVFIPKAGTITYARLFASFSTAGGADAWVMNIHLNETTSTLIESVSVSATTRTWVNAALNIPVVAGDYFSIESVGIWGSNFPVGRGAGTIYVELA